MHLRSLLALAALALAALCAAPAAHAQSTTPATPLTDAAYPRFRFTGRAPGADTLYIVIDEQYADLRRVPTGAPVPLPPGLHRLLISARGLRDNRTELLAATGDTATVWLATSHLKRWQSVASGSAYPVFALGANLAVFTEPGAEVYIDGVRYGEGQVLKQLPPGRARVEVRKDGAVWRSEDVSVRPDRLRSVELYHPRRWTSRALALLPGASQAYEGRPLRALLLGGLFVASAVGGYSRHQIFLRRDRQYQQAVEEYVTFQPRSTVCNYDLEWPCQDYFSTVAYNETTWAALTDQMHRKYDRASGAANARNLFYGFAAATFMYNLYDAYRSSAFGNRPRQSSGPAAVFSPMLLSDSIGLQAGIRF